MCFIGSSLFLLLKKPIKTSKDAITVAEGGEYNQGITNMGTD